MRGLTVGGTNINNLRYADDTVLHAESEKDLQNLIIAVNRAGEKFGVKVNPVKTKVMVISTKNSDKIKIMLGGVQLDQVECFTYLGHAITEDGKCEKEIKVRYGIFPCSHCVVIYIILEVRDAMFFEVQT